MDPDNGGGKKNLQKKADVVTRKSCLSDRFYKLELPV